MMKPHLLRGLGVIVVVSACGKKAPPAPPTPDVLVTSVLQRDVPVYSTWIGTLNGSVNATIQSQVSGYLLKQDYREGTFVRQGDVLFQIDPRPFQAQLAQAEGQLERAKAALGKANTDVARYKPLVEQQAVSQQELDNALSAQQAAQGAMTATSAAADQARLNLEWATVRSPVNGVAGIALAQVGNLIKQNDEMTTVSTVDPIKVVFNISEREYLQYSSLLNQIGRAAPGEGRLELVLENDSVYGHRGRVITANRQVDVRTGTMEIQGLFPNPASLLRPGQYARVRAVVQVRKGALLVPQRAVNELQGAYQVVVVGADSTAEFKAVQPGVRIGSLWVIESGLAPGDQVVVEGLQRIRPGMKVAARPDTSKAPADVAPAAKD
jgi:membrane fusion protein (multidrug efflux system)